MTTPLVNRCVLFPQVFCMSAEELAKGLPAQSITSLGDRGRAGRLAAFPAPRHTKGRNEALQGAWNAQVPIEAHEHDEINHQLRRQFAAPPLGLLALFPDHCVD